MKKLIYSILTISFVLGLTSCAKTDWDTPDTYDVYGNRNLEATNVKTISEIKDMYKAQVSTSYSYKEVKSPMQIIGVVTGNDIGGNMYSEIAVQDETGAMIVAISQGGIWGYLPLGTQVLIELNGLFVGNYGLQPEIGTPYTNASNSTYVSRMSPMLWQSHYKVLCYGIEPEAKVFAEGNNKTTWDLFDDAGKLGVIKNVSLKQGGRTTWANPNSGSGYKSIYFNEQSQSVMVYTSNYADFAADTIPSGKMNLYGIFKRYNDKWEIILRSIEDCQLLIEN